MSAAGRLAQHAVCTYLQARLLCVPSLRAVSCQARVALQWAAVRFHCILPPTPHRPPCCHHMQQYSGETYSGPACRYHLRITLEGTPGTAAQLASELRRRGLCRVYFSMCSNLRTKIMCFGECTPAGGGGGRKRFTLGGVVADTGKGAAPLCWPSIICYHGISSVAGCGTMPGGCWRQTPQLQVANAKACHVCVCVCLSVCLCVSASSITTC